MIHRTDRLEITTRNFERLKYYDRLYFFPPLWDEPGSESLFLFRKTNLPTRLIYRRKSQEYDALSFFCKSRLCSVRTSTYIAFYLSYSRCFCTLPFFLFNADPSTTGFCALTTGKRHEKCSKSVLADVG